MEPENSAKIKYGVWGLICGGIISMIIGFGWMGWLVNSRHYSTDVRRGGPGKSSGDLCCPICKATQS